MNLKPHLNAHSIMAVGYLKKKQSTNMTLNEIETGHAKLNILAIFDRTSQCN